MEALCREERSMSETVTATDIIVLRRRLGLSQQGLAERIGVSATTVWRWEHCRTRPTRLARMALAQIGVE